MAAIVKQNLRQVSLFMNKLSLLFQVFSCIFLFVNMFCKKDLAYGKYIQDVSIPVTTE